MKTDKEQLKAQLVEKYERHLDKLFEQVDPDSDLDLTEIEGAALKVRQVMGQELTQGLADTQDQGSAKEVSCQQCGERMRYKGHKPKYVRTRSGEIRIKRAYYHCSTCQTGHFPPR
jgi:DNA-directed RNA polymerase subunit RPC12/RpoP